MGAVSDNFDERIEQKIFHTEILADSAKVVTETKAYQAIPILTDFTDENVMNDQIKENYRQIKLNTQ